MYVVSSVDCALGLSQSDLSRLSCLLPFGPSGCFFIQTPGHRLSGRHALLELSVDLSLRAERAMSIQKTNLSPKRDQRNQIASLGVMAEAAAASSTGVLD